MNISTALFLLSVIHVAMWYTIIRDLLKEK